MVDAESERATEGLWGEETPSSGGLEQKYLMRIRQGGEIVLETEELIRPIELKNFNPDFYASLGGNGEGSRLTDIGAAAMPEAFSLGLADKFKAYFDGSRWRGGDDIENLKSLADHATGGLYRALVHQIYPNMISFMMKRISKEVADSYFLNGGDEKKILALDLVPDFCFRSDVDFKEINDPSRVNGRNPEPGYKDAPLRRILGTGVDQEKTGRNILKEGRIQRMPVKGTLVGNEVIRKQIIL